MNWVWGTYKGICVDGKLTRQGMELCNFILGLDAGTTGGGRDQVYIALRRRKIADSIRGS
jgi:hypothetical protein